MSTRAFYVSPVSVCPASSRAQMRAQIWFLSSWFALLQHARPRTLLPFGFIPSSSTHHYGEWSVTHECPAVMPTVLQTATAQVDPWRLLAVDGGSGASRGHAPVMRGPRSRRSRACHLPCAWDHLLRAVAMGIGPTGL